MQPDNCLFRLPVSKKQLKLHVQLPPTPPSEGDGHLPKPGTERKSFSNSWEPRSCEARAEFISAGGRGTKQQLLEKREQKEAKKMGKQKNQAFILEGIKGRSAKESQKRSNYGREEGDSRTGRINKGGQTLEQLNCD